MTLSAWPVLNLLKQTPYSHRSIVRFRPHCPPLLSPFSAFWWSLVRRETSLWPPCETVLHDSFAGTACRWRRLSLPSSSLRSAKVLDTSEVILLFSLRPLKPALRVRCTWITTPAVSRPGRRARRVEVMPRICYALFEALLVLGGIARTPHAVQHSS